MAWSSVPEIERFRGALLAGAMGDALGAPVETLPAHVVRERHGRLVDYQRGRHEPGQVTDDTQLTICVADTLTVCGYLNPDDFVHRLLCAWPGVRGRGHATTEAVHRLQKGIPWTQAGTVGDGNGAAMRSAPIGLVRWDDPVLLRAEAILSALPTHRGEMGVAGAVVMAAAAAYLVRQEPTSFDPGAFVAALQRSIAGMESSEQPERRDPSIRTTLHDRLALVLDLVDRSPPDAFDRLWNGAYVLESLPAALYCFLRSPTDVEEVLLRAVNMGRDADTVAAMAGTMSGALNGFDGLPQRLLANLEERDYLEVRARRLHSLAATGDSTSFLASGDEYDDDIPNHRLRQENVPTDTELAGGWAPFASTFDGYRYWGSHHDHEQESLGKAWSEGRKLPANLTELRTVLFWQQRWYHWNSHLDPELEPNDLIPSVISAIRTLVPA